MCEDAAPTARSNVTSKQRSTTDESSPHCRSRRLPRDPIRLRGGAVRAGRGREGSSPRSSPWPPPRTPLAPPLSPPPLELELDVQRAEALHAAAERRVVELARAPVEQQARAPAGVLEAQAR